MQITLETKPFATLETDALVSYVFEDSEPVQGRIAELDQFTEGLLKKLATSGELTGKLSRQPRKPLRKALSPPTLNPTSIKLTRKTPSPSSPLL